MTVTVHPAFKQSGSDEFFHKAYRAIAFEYYKRITMKTPRKTGRAAGNWQISINRPAPAENERLLPTQGTFSSREAAKLSKSKVVRFPEIIISNALPYILALEFGHSGQAASGMVRVTFAELSGWSAKGLNK